MEKINERIISPDATIIQAMKQMDRIDKKLLIILNKELFAGLISIGDIQRALINGKDLNTKIENITRKNIKYAKPSDSISEIKKIMTKFRMEFLPVLKNNRIINVYFWEELFGEKENNKTLPAGIPVVVMAGGEGTRMRPLTHVIPKPLVPIGNKPIIEEIINKFKKAGCKEFILSVNYKHEFIKLHFDLIKEKDYTIKFIKEDKPNGTAGSLSLLKNRIKTTFFLSNCDIILTEEYTSIYEYHKKNQNDLTIVGSLRTYNIPYGTLKTGRSGKLISMNEKPDISHFINSGIYILEPQILKIVPMNRNYNITDLITDIKKRKGRIGVFPVREGSLIDLGNWGEYSKALENN